MFFYQPFFERKKKSNLLLNRSQNKTRKKIFAPKHENPYKINRLYLYLFYSEDCLILNDL